MLMASDFNFVIEYHDVLNVNMRSHKRRKTVSFESLSSCIRKPPSYPVNLVLIVSVQCPISSDQALDDNSFTQFRVGPVAQ
jgi:hypothetical protein